MPGRRDGWAPVVTPRRWIALLACAATAVLAVFVGVPLMIVAQGSDPTSSSCGDPGMAPGGAGTAPTDPAGLAEAQARNAATIVATGEQMHVPPQGIVVALAVAGQESGFRMLANDGSDPRLRPEQKDVARSLQYPHDGVGRDHGSVNFMQQQYPWWGSLDELMNPQIAAVKFYTALLKVPGWQSLSVTAAAQTVQSSAFPDAYADDEVLARRLYAEHEGAGADAAPLAVTALQPDTESGDEADTVTSAVDLVAADVLCGGGAALDCAATGDPAEAGLTPDAVRVMRCITEHFGIRPWATIGPRPAGADRDHEEGRAVDAMMTQGEDDYRTPLGKAKGDRIAGWVVANADALGVKNVIWYERIWTRNQDGVGHPGTWAPYDYPSGGGDTVAHRDHLHVSVYGNSAITTPGAGIVVGDGNARLPIDAGKFVITSGYGPRWGTFHAGLDFAAAAGTPIYAVTGGTVTQAGNLGDGYGNCVVITAGTTETRYAHQIDGGIRVQVGATVAAGDLIGAVGTTGDSTGNHLHYEVRIDGKSTDPMPYLSTIGLNPEL